MNSVATKGVATPIPIFSVILNDDTSSHFIITESAETCTDLITLRRTANLIFFDASKENGMRRGRFEEFGGRRPDIWRKTDVADLKSLTHHPIIPSSRLIIPALCLWCLMFAATMGTGEPLDGEAGRSAPADTISSSPIAPFDRLLGTWEVTQSILNQDGSWSVKPQQYRFYNLAVADIL